MQINLWKNDYPEQLLYSMFTTPYFTCHRLFMGLPKRVHNHVPQKESFKTLFCNLHIHLYTTFEYGISCHLFSISWLPTLLRVISCPPKHVATARVPILEHTQNILTLHPTLFKLSPLIWLPLKRNGILHIQMSVTIIIEGREVSRAYVSIACTSVTAHAPGKNFRYV